MSNLDIAIHAANDPLPIWPGLGQPSPGTVTHCAVLQQGTRGAGPAVAFNIEMARGNVFAELSLQDVQLIWFSLKGALEQWEDAEKGKTASSEPTEPVQVDIPIPEIPPQPPQPPIPHEPENRQTPAARRPRQQPKRPQPQTPIPPDAPPEAA